MCRRSADIRELKEDEVRVLVSREGFGFSRGLKRSENRGGGEIHQGSSTVSDSSGVEVGSVPLEVGDRNYYC